MSLSTSGVAIASPSPSVLVPHAAAVPPAPAAPAIAPDEVRFVRARGAGQLRRVAHLREEIALPAELRAAPAFVRLEKKETNWAS
jgi:hypothetical protein